MDKEATYEGRACWVLTLTAKKAGVAYHKRIVYVDKQRYLALFEEWYAKSGKLLKTIKVSDVQSIGSRWYPRKIEFKDKLKEGKGTEYFIDKIEFDTPIPKQIFTKAVLRK